MRSKRRLKLRNRKLVELKKILEERQHKTDDVWKCVTQKQQEVQQNRYRSLKEPGRLQRTKPKNEKLEMEVQIEKVVKAQKEAQSADEVADREEQTSHNRESKAQVAPEEPKAISKGRPRGHPV